MFLLKIHNNKRDICKKKKEETPDDSVFWARDWSMTLFQAILSYFLHILGLMKLSILSVYRLVKGGRGLFNLFCIIVNEWEMVFIK